MPNTNISTNNQTIISEHDSCAVGAILSQQKDANNKVIDLALEFLEKLPHRGGQIFTQYEGETIKVGDGAGISCDIDWDYYGQILQNYGISERMMQKGTKPYGIGNIFLPNEKEEREKSIKVIKEICEENGVDILHDNNNHIWRSIEFASDDSENAKKLKLQNFKQCFLAPKKANISPEEFEKTLQKIHREIEKYSHNLNQHNIQKEELPNLAVASLSCKRIVYKGMLLPNEVKYFTDLSKSNPQNIIYHIRQSTNTKPSPGNSQPFFIIGHNGEINSIEGNADKSHRKPRGFSDSRTFDEHLRELLSQGKDLIEAITTLMPPLQGDDDEVNKMIEDIRSKEMEYNGPAHMVFADDNSKGSKLDSSALRPCRYVVVKDQEGKNHLITGSEDMLSNKQAQNMGWQIVERGMLKAGEMVVMEDGIVKKSQQILSELKDRYKPSNQQIEEITAQETKFPDNKLDLGQRELEIRKYQMLPLIQGAIKKMAMGDDTNPMKADINDAPNVADHFKQKFSQVSSPPIDSVKERDSFQLPIYLGNQLGLEKGGTRYKVDSPILKLGELEDVKQKANDKIVEFDLTIDLSQLSEEQRADEEYIFKLFRDKIRQICSKAEQQIKQGKSIIILDSSQISANKIALPEILITAALHSHLHKNRLEKQASIIVNSAQMENAHHFSVLSAMGAAAVNPISGYDFAAQLAEKEKSESEKTAKYHQYCQNFQKAIENAHLVSMGKYGITSTATYCGSRLMESITLNLNEKEQEGEKYDPSCLSNAFRATKHCNGFIGKFGVNDLLKDAIINHQNRYNNKIITSGHFAYSPSGVKHSYNPTIVKAIRDATTQYRAKRQLSAQYQQRADNIAQKANKISENESFAIDEYKTNLSNKNKEFDRKILEANQQIASLQTQNDKLFNSLFFIGKISTELQKLTLRKESEFHSRNEVAIRQFLSVISQEEESENISSLLQKHKARKITITDLQKALLKKAGYDGEEIEKIKKWSKLLKDNNPEEATKIFNELNQHNKDRINAVFDEYNQNQTRINQLREEITAIEPEYTVNNILLDIANSDQISNKDSYLEAIKQKQEDLKTESQNHNLLPKINQEEGKFEIEEINNREIDQPFANAIKSIQEDKDQSPVTIADHLTIQYPQDIEPTKQEDVDTVADIAANHFVTGGMSHGALTLPAHNDIAKAAWLVGSKACTGEGGKPEGQKAKLVQIASGRFGINPEYFADADIIEIKIAQGAKPGEGGMLPPGKVSVEIAAIRGSTVGVGLISPPPHHDIYSIEDLQELIKDCKEAKPKVEVAVKLCASEGIDQIAIGVAKSGADIINIAGGSGGTGAAASDSIKQTGLPTEIGLAMVHQALSKAGIRNLVKLEASGFPPTPEGIIKMAILGGDILETGTTDLMLLGCDMHRKCNVPGACGPGITNNVEGYQGSAEDLALYKINMAKEVQNILRKLGVKTLKDLHGRVDLLSAQMLQDSQSDEFIAALLADTRQYEQLDPKFLEQYRQAVNETSNKEQYDKLEEEKQLSTKITAQERSIIDIGEVDVTNRAFGAALSYKYYKELKDKAKDHITIKTSGVIGQSFGFINTNGFCLEHSGSAQDGFGKSMNGGVLVVKQPESEINITNSTYVGNAALYGASAGSAFIPSAGSRCGVLMKGATLVVNGDIGDYGCEYMTSGSAVILGKIGKYFGNGMSGGIAALYQQSDCKISADVRKADIEEAEPYLTALKALLEEDLQRTGNLEVRRILDNFETEKQNFQIVIPKALDRKNTLEEFNKFKESVHKRKNVVQYGQQAISPFERIWLESQEKKFAKQGLEGVKKEPESIEEDLISGSSESINSQLEPDEQIITTHSKIVSKIIEHQDRMRQYGPLAARIVGGLGVPDQHLSDNIDELYDELFNHTNKCSCDSVTCTSSVSGQSVKEAKHPDSGCPLGKNPNLINTILNDKSTSKEERAKEAFKMQIKESPFAGFTGLACPAPCQDSCTHSAADEGNASAVKIKRIELLLHKIAFSKGWYDEQEVFKAADVKQDKKVMIIGSGPSALEAAYHLAKAGIAVEIFEKEEKIGGLLRYGIPDHKLQKDVIDFYVDNLKKMGIKFHTGQKIDMENIKTNHPDYDLYLDARGIADKPKVIDERFNKTNYQEGGNHFLAMDFLSYCNEYVAKMDEERMKLPENEQQNFYQIAIDMQHPFEKFNLGKKIAVIGSADTAEDVKRSVLKLNSQLPENEKVTLITINRQPQQSQRAKTGSNYPNPREQQSQDLQQEIDNEFNFEQSQHYDNTAPLELISNDNKTITAIKCDKTYVIANQYSRNLRDRGQKIAEEEIKCDSVITAIGFNNQDLHSQEVKSLNEIKAGSIVPIGDVATKSGFVKDGNELIVSAQNSAKIVVNKFLDSIQSNKRSKVGIDYEKPKTSPNPQDTSPLTPTKQAVEIM